ncbi:hypothetical protein F66182_853 [Fusarium sp. NRRL 66182]|nr:hypothetical protein F66182_853 [Fusarium sp. NRRL 66182]
MEHQEVDSQLDGSATPTLITKADEKQERELEEGPPSVDLDDTNVVNWDGPTDPANPQNWSTKKKAITVVIVSSITFVTPLASSIFAPSITQVMADFNSTDEQIASFIVSVYLLGYCFGPLIVAPLSEMYGRLPLYHVCNLLFIIFNVACALAPNLGGLIAFRFLAGLAGCCPLTVGAGSVADMISAEKRGAAMASWVAGPLLGPVIGPIAGGYLAVAKGWRWSFWVVAIVTGAITILAFAFMEETYAYAILEKKTKKLRKQTGNTGLRSALDKGTTTRELFSMAMVRPTKMLLFSPIVSLLSLYMSIVYGYLYLLFTAMPLLFEGEYHFSSGAVGLTYLGIGVGSIVGLVIAAATSDRLVAHLTRKNGGKAKPEYRLPIIAGGCVIVPVGLFLYGWSAENRNHWIVPIIGTGLVGGGIVIMFLSISVYLVDAFVEYAASATAASTVLRALGGALLPMAGRSMYESLGYGWGTSLLGFIAAAAIPLPLIFFKYGERIRRKNLFDVKF